MHSHVENRDSPLDGIGCLYIKKIGQSLKLSLYARKRSSIYLYFAECKYAREYILKNRFQPTLFGVFSQHIFLKERCRRNQSE